MYVLTTKLIIYNIQLIFHHISGAYCKCGLTLMAKFLILQLLLQCAQ